TKDPVYPIKTYQAFEHPDEEKMVDPMSAFLELMAKIKKEEFVGIHIILRPADKDEWVTNKKTLELLEKIKKPSAKPSSPDDLFSKFTIRTPGETAVLEAVENNLSKPPFDTIIRFMYVSPRDIFYDSYARRGFLGIFNQYSSLDLNGFRINYDISTRTQVYDYPFIFARTRNTYRKQRMMYMFRGRITPPDSWIGKWITSYWFNSAFGFKSFKLNTEGVASLFHPPTAMVLTAPHIHRIESKKAGPPAGLAIFGDEEAIERFTNNKK
ncbi:MAG: hypothetical protein WC730_04140, partial [Patescibacteria group bacterium]